MLIRHALHLDTESAADGAYCVIQPGALLEHRFTICGADIVQVDIHGEARDVEYKQVERGPTFERDPVFEKRMAPEGLDQLQEPNGLLQRFRLEPGGRGGSQ